jgi:hypothetical protein
VRSSAASSAGIDGKRLARIDREAAVMICSSAAGTAVPAGGSRTLPCVTE